VLGHSLGGVNAFQLAARRPELVRALIVEDIGPVVDVDFAPFLAGWPERFPSAVAAHAFLSERVPGGEGYFLASLVEDGGGWRFRFRYDHMIRSQRATNGDWWADWEASDCPALLLHGRKSWGLTTSDAREMAARRPNTRLVEFADCGHVVHDDDPAGFARAVTDFLGTL
jgi:pimeloyl-ACP methyl ester carboxylesterase